MYNVKIRYCDLNTGLSQSHAANISAWWKEKVVVLIFQKGKFKGSILFWNLLVWGLPVWRLMKIEKYVLVWGCSWEGECGLAQFDKNLRSETSSRSSPSPQYHSANTPPHIVVDATVWLQKKKEYKLLLRSETSSPTSPSSSPYPQ